MTPEAWTTLAVLGAVVLAMLWVRVRLDVLGITVPIVLVLLGLLPASRALAGFGNPAVLALMFIFIITRGLERSGATAILGRLLVRQAQNSPRRGLLVMLVTTALLSLVMNTVAAAAVALAPARNLARRLGVSPSQLLLPVAYAALLGGMATLLTTANLVADAALRQAGLPGFHLLSFLPVGLPVAAVGLAFLFWAAPRLLPQKPQQAQEARDLSFPLESYDLVHGLHALQVVPGSPLVGRSARRPYLARTLGLTPLARMQGRRFEPVFRLEGEALEAGDVLIVAGNPQPERLRALGLRLLPQKGWLEDYLQQVPWMEVAVHPHGHAVGRTPQELRLRERYAALVVALWRTGKALYHALYREPLQQGDALLVQGPPEGLESLSQDPDFLPLTPPRRPVSRRRAALALAWWGLVLLLAAAVRVPLAWAILLGIAGMAWTGLLSMDEGYRSVDWRSVFLIAGFLPLGEALLRTGVADALTRWLLPQDGTWPLPALLALLVGLASLLAQVLGGQVSALLLAPWALALAQRQGVSPQIAVMAVALGSSMAFLLPTGHPANLLMMGPGGYTPRDYLRLGLPLTLVVYPALVLTLWWWH